MKNVTLAVLAMALTLPMATSAQVSKAEARSQAKTEFVKKAVKGTQTPAPIFKASKAAKVVKPKAEVPAGSVEITFHVENVWGDGSGYQLLIGSDEMATAETWGALYGAATYTVPEGADYDANTENKIIEGSQSIIVPAGEYGYCVTNPTPGDQVYVANNGRGTYNFAEGAAYEVYVYGNSSVGDNVAIINLNAAATPTDVIAEPTATTADINWVAGEYNEGWNLRYRPYIDPATANLFFDFDEDLDAQLDDWYIIDNDKDGNNWSTRTLDNGFCLTSASYDNNSGALTPDNWLVTPTFKLGGTVKFDAWGQDPSYAAEVFRVYVLVGEEWESVDDFVAISDDITTNGTPTEFEFDLSDYEGVGRVAIRHYNCTDEFMLNIDNVYIAIPNGVDLPEWTVVENVETPYTIEGLTPETNYEVQVMGFNATSESEWTASTLFTTLEETVAVEQVRVSDAADNVWYNLQGMKLNGVPTQPGLYINGGKKVLVK